MTRAEVVAEARAWVGTPYLAYSQGVKGAGANCATLLFGVYRACGIIPDEQVGVFSPDWWAHAKQDTYMFRILRHAAKVAEVVCYRSTEMLPGNVILCRLAGSRVYNHGAIVTAWPLVVHAILPTVAEIDASREPMWSYQEIAAFDPWKKQEIDAR